MGKLKEHRVSVNWEERIPTRHVVVIEDSQVVQMLLKETLAELGFTSTAFDNSVAALTYLLHIQGNCTLIIADQGLPGRIQGIEFIHMAKKRWPSIPSILTSGHLEENQVVPPSTTYLRKPYTLEQLESTVANVLSETHIP